MHDDVFLSVRNVHPICQKEKSLLFNVECKYILIYLFFLAAHVCHHDNGWDQPIEINNGDQWPICIWLTPKFQIKASPVCYVCMVYACGYFYSFTSCSQRWTTLNAPNWLFVLNFPSPDNINCNLRNLHKFVRECEQRWNQCVAHRNILWWQWI